MKRLVLTFALLTLVLPFIVQYPLNMYNHAQITMFQMYVHTAVQQAKGEGYFTEDITDDLEEKLRESFSVTSDEITMDFGKSNGIKYRTTTFSESELIYYSIGIPIKKLIAASTLFKIEDGNNQRDYVITGYASSEKINDNEDEDD